MFDPDDRHGQLLRNFGDEQTAARMEIPWGGEELLAPAPVKDGITIIPPGIGTIDSFVYASNRELRHVEFPDSLEYIGEGSFLDCSNLEELVLPKNLFSIFPEAFSGCSGLRSVQFHDKLNSIEEAAFSDCSKLTEIILPASVQCIGPRAFSGCTGLKRFVIQSEELELGEQVLAGCSKNVEIVVPPGMDIECVRSSLGLAEGADQSFFIVDKELLRCTGEDEVIHIPDGVERIADGALDFAINTHKAPVVIEMPASIQNWSLNDRLSSSKVKFRFPPEIFEKKKLSAQVWSTILKSYEPNELPADFLLRAFVHSSPYVNENTERHFATPEGVDLLLEYLSRASGKVGRRRTTDFFFKHRDAFTPEQTTRLGEILGRQSGWKQKGPPTSALPEPILDEVLVQHYVDPAHPVFSQVKDAATGELVSSELVKRALVPYLVDGKPSSTGSRQYVSRQFFHQPSAEEYAVRLDSEDMSKVVHAICRDELAHELGSGKGNLRGLMLPLCRFASDAETQDMLADYTSRARNNFCRFDFLEALTDAMALSHSQAGLSWLIESSKSDKDFKRLDKFVYARCGKPPLHPVIPECFHTDEEGRILLLGKDSPLAAEVGPGLSLTLCNLESGKTWKRLPRSWGCSTEEQEKLKASIAALTGYLDQLFSTLSRTILPWYWQDTELPAEEILDLFKEPLVAKALSGLIWEQQGFDFAYVDGVFVDHTGKKVEVDAKTPIRVGHVLDLGAQRMAEWDAFLTTRNTSPWLYQTDEPAYDLAKIHKNRYHNMVFRPSALRAPGMAEFLEEAINDLISGNSRKNADRAHVYYAHRKYKSDLLVQLLDLKTASRRNNLFLFLLDSLTMADQIRAHNASAIPVLRSLTPAKLKNLLRLAQDTKQTDFSAAILDLQNQRKKGRRNIAQEFHL